MDRLPPVPGRPFRAGSTNPTTPARTPLARLAGLALLPALALGACGGDDGGDAAPATTAAPRTTSTTARPATTTTTAAPDPAVVPDVIDDAYVQAVMDELDVLLQDAYAVAAAEGTFDGGFATKVRALFGGPEAEGLLEDLRRIGVEPFVDPPGRPTTEVRDVATARRDCIFLTADRDLTPLADEPYEQVQPYYLHLVAGIPGPDNPLPWVLARDVWFADGSTLEDQCA